MITDELLQKYLGISLDQYNKFNSQVQASTASKLEKAIRKNENEEERSADLTTLSEDLANRGKNYNKLKALGDTLGITDYAGEAKATQEAADDLSELEETANSTYGTIIDALGGADAIKSYVSAVTEANNTIDNTDLSYDKTVDQFMDPAAEYVINQSVKAAQNAMAGQGGLSGGAAAAELQAVASEKASDEYDDAWERMMQDQENELALKKANVDLSQSKLSNLSGLSDDIINTLLTQLATDSNLEQSLAQLNLDSGSGSAFSDLLTAASQGSQIYSNMSK